MWPLGRNILQGQHSGSIMTIVLWTSRLSPTFFLPNMEDNGWKMKNLIAVEILNLLEEISVVP